MFALQVTRKERTTPPFGHPSAGGELRTKQLSRLVLGHLLRLVDDGLCLFDAGDIDQPAI